MSIRLDERRYVEEVKWLVADFRMWKNPLVPLPDGFEDDLAGHAHDFVLDQVKYGRQTSGPWDVAKMFIPGLAQLNDAADAVNNAGEGFVYAGSAIRSFMVER